MEYLFVIATVIFVFGYLFIFQKSLKDLIKDSGNVSLQKVQAKFFIRIAFLEIIPFITIVAAFILLQGHPGDYSLPTLIIGFLFVIALLWIFFSYRRAKVKVMEESIKSALDVFFIISIPILGMIPIISIVFLVLLGDGTL